MVGEVPPLSLTIGASILCLSLCALLDGLLFALGYRIYTKEFKLETKAVGIIYVMESIGTIVGGVIFTFILLKLLTSFQIASFLIIINFLFLLIFLNKRLKAMPLIKIILLVCFVICVLFLPWASDILHNKSIQKQWPDKNIIAYKNSLHSNLVITEKNKQYDIYSDGIPFLSLPQPDTFFVEEFVHIPMSLIDKPNNILFIGPCIGGPLKELLRYPINSITYTEPDPEIIRLIQKHIPSLISNEIKDPRLKINYVDAKRFINTTQERYDCIFINLSIPVSLETNRFYTHEFFLKLSKRLNKNGIVILHTWGSLTYLSKELKKLNSCVMKTLSGVFQDVRVIPGDFNLIIASKQIIPDFSSKAIVQNLNKNNISTQLLTSDYLNYRLSDQFKNWFNDSIKDTYPHSVKENYDLKPSGIIYGLNLYYAQFYPHLVKKLSTFKSFYIFLILGLGLFLFGIIVFTRKNEIHKIIPPIIISTGFISMSVQILLLFCFQIVLGVLYSLIAMLTAVFMGGVAWGAYVANKKIASLLLLKKIEILMFAFLGILMCIIYITSQYNMHHVVITMLFFFISGVNGYLVGRQFPLACNIYTESTGRTKNVAGKLYCLDLIGASIGAILISIILVPQIGIYPTIIFLTFFKLITLGKLKNI